MESEFNDWEFLHNSAESDDKQTQQLGAVIQSEYFSVDSEKKPGLGSEDGSVESCGDPSSWVDPVLEDSSRKVPSEVWSVTGSDRFDDRGFGEFEVKNEFGFEGNEGFGAGDSGSAQCDQREFQEFVVKDELGFVGKEKIWSGVEGDIEESDRLEKFESSAVENVSGSVSFEGGELVESRGKDIEDVWYDSGGDGRMLSKAEVKGGVEVLEEVSSAAEDSRIVLSGFDGKNGLDDGLESESVSTIEAKEMKEPGRELEKRRVVWWKVPFDFLKYCVFRFNPVLSLSVAAALMGVVIYGQRLYKMKRKSRLLELKVTMDDKKVSQFMSSAARFNEAFSVVRRVAVIRPSLPASGMGPWPAMNLR